MVSHINEEDDPTGDFITEYLRVSWLAEYYDGDESNPEINQILNEDFDGMHLVLFDDFGNEIYDDGDEEIWGYEGEDALAEVNEIDDDDEEEEVEDLEWGETYESRVLDRLLQPMHDWQEEALQVWEASDHAGIIEAVTGSGKTLLGIIAAAKALDANLGVVVVVPTRVLQEQWIAEMHSFLAKNPDGESAVIGGLGGEYGSDVSKRATKPSEGKIVVAVAATFSLKSEYHPLASEAFLLIADEVHQYSGEKHSQVFHQNFERRLGLTATFEPVLGRYRLYENYFGESPLFSYTFKDAIREDVVSEYDVVLVRVMIPIQIKIEYDRIWNRVRKIEDQLRFYTKISFDPEKVHREISFLKEEKVHLGLIGEWENLNDQLDTLMNNKATKESTIRLLSTFIKSRGHTVIFTDYVDLAEQLQSILTINGVYSKLLDSRVRQTDRREAFDLFEQGELKALVSPRVLDEGVNLPLLSFGIFAGVRRRRLQLVQRLGRVLRKNPEKTWPLICIPVNIDTFEDPCLEGNQQLPYSPLSLILQNASRVLIVDAKDEIGVKRVFDSYIGDSQNPF